MIQKTFYEAPETELILVKFEENFCGTNDGTEKPIDGGDEEF